VTMWTPTRLNNGEGWHPLRKQPTDARGGVHRGRGNSTGVWFFGQRGKATGGEQSRRSTASSGGGPPGFRRGS
jgi:hypothetical protein